MAASESERCERCGRLAPAWEDPAYSEWEAIERDDGEVGIICPGCISRVEQAEIDADDLDVVESLKRCTRCGREAPPGRQQRR